MNFTKGIKPIEIEREQTNKDGTKEIIKDKFYVKRDFLGYRVVEPIKDPETNKFIWKNFLNKKGFITLGFIVLLILFGWLAYKEQISNYSKVMNNPCAYCIDCQKHTIDVLQNTTYSSIKINLSELDLRK